MIFVILAQIAPVLMIVGLGFLWARLHMRFDTETIGTVVLKIGTPCLIFSSLTQTEIALNVVGLNMISAVMVIAITAALATIVLRLFELPLHTFLPSVIHANTGNMGLPLSAMIFGDVGLALGIGYFLIMATSQNTLGLAIATGRLDLRDFLRQPVIHASILTAGVLLFAVPVPDWIARTTELLGGMVIPMMLLLLGVSLSQLRVTDLRLALGITALHLAASALGALSVIWALGLVGMQAGIIWIMATMPVAVANIIYAERFGRSPELIAGVIVVSTVTTLAALPILVWVAAWIAA